MKGSQHIFAEIAKRHGIVSVAIDKNFKVGARSKKGWLLTLWFLWPPLCRDLKPNFSPRHRF